MSLSPEEVNLEHKAEAKMVALAQFCYEQSQGEHDLFFEYSPLMNCVKIDAYAGGGCPKWSGDPDYSKWISLDRYYDQVDAETIKQSIIDFLEVC